VPTISNEFASTTKAVTLAAGEYCVVVSPGASIVPPAFTSRFPNNDGKFRLDVKCSGRRRLGALESHWNLTSSAVLTNSTLDRRPRTQPTEKPQAN
jgi:hypothetical protein